MTSTDPASTTLRLTMPQWQAGDGGDQGYRVGAAVLDALAPVPADTTICATVPVDPSGADFATVDGVYAHDQILRQFHATQRILDHHRPDKIMIIGGDCSVDVVPFSYLNHHYDGDLAVLWFDAHADWSTTEDWPHFNAMAVRALVGESVPSFTAALDRPLARHQLAYVGLREGITSSRPHRVTATVPFHAITVAEALSGPDPILDWLNAAGHSHVAIHIDVDVLDQFSSTPGLTTASVVTAIKAVAARFDVVGLGIAEFRPRGAQTLSDMLAQLPLFQT